MRKAATPAEVGERPFRAVVATIVSGLLTSLAAFTIVLYTTRPVDGAPAAAWIVLGAGVSVTLVAGIGLLRAVRRSTAAEEAVAERTAELTATRSTIDEVLDRVGDAVVVTDADGTIAEWNDAATRLFGVPRPTRRGRCRDVLALRTPEHELDCSAGCALLDLLGDADRRAGVEVWRQLPDGGERALLATVGAVDGVDGGAGAVVHSFRDITRLKQADEAKTMFLATASHELRTPLAVIHGFAEILAASEVVDDERRLAADTILRRVGELSQIVDRLLLSSRLEQGRVELALREVAVEPVVRERVHPVRAETRRTIHTDLHPPIPTVTADPAALATVVDHLLDNALKYSADDTPVTVSVRSVADAVVLSVADHGMGMDEEQATRCFDKFWQAEQGDRRRFGGTGIGLYIVQSLVVSMGGSITVASRPGEGATFTVALRPWRSAATRTRPRTRRHPSSAT